MPIHCGKPYRVVDYIIRHDEVLEDGWYMEAIVDWLNEDGDVVFSRNGHSLENIRCLGMQDAIRKRDAFLKGDI
jgi:hypothetical protein